MTSISIELKLKNWYVHAIIKKNIITFMQIYPIKSDLYGVVYYKNNYKKFGKIPKEIDIVDLQVKLLAAAKVLTKKV